MTEHGADQIALEVPHVIPYFLVEGFFQRKLEQTGLTARIFEKIVDLDSPNERGSFFELKAVTDELQKTRGFDGISTNHRFEADALKSYNTVRTRARHLDTSEVNKQGKGNGNKRKEKRT